jgi:hypothetical protein
MTIKQDAVSGSAMESQEFTGRNKRAAMHARRGRARFTRAMAFLFCSALSLGALAQTSYEFISHRTDRSDTGYGKNSHVSSDGRFVVYISSDSTLVTPNAPGYQIYLYDRTQKTTELISVSNAGVAGNGSSSSPMVSDDGCRVVFASDSSNLVVGDTNGIIDVFVRDRCTASPQTSAVSVSSSGVLGNAGSDAPRISANGRYVIFSSYTSNLVPPYGGSTWNTLYVRDLQNSTTSILGTYNDPSRGVLAIMGSYPDISADGKKVVFFAYGRPESPALWQIYSYDRNTSTLAMVSTDAAGVAQAQVGGTSNGHEPAISGDGLWAAFASPSKTLIPGVTDGFRHVYVKNLSTGAIRLADATAAGVPGNADSSGYGSGVRPAISYDGRYVAFPSYATNLVTATAYVKPLLRDMTTNQTTLVADRSVDNETPGLSSAARFVTFTTNQTTLDPNFVNVQGLYLADLAPVNAVRNAFFVNASTSLNKTTVLRLINSDSHSGSLTATAYDEAGNVVGTAGASLGNFAGQQMLTFTSAQLEALIGYLPSAPTAKYRVVFSANVPGFSVVDFVKDVATGNLALGQAQVDKPVSGSSSTSQRNALFLNASTSTNKTSVLRLINPGSQSGVVRATAYNEAGVQIGGGNVAVGTLGAQQMMTFTSAQLELALGFAPATPTAKYSVVFTANLPSFEVINFIKDIASGNLTLAQAQTYDRGASTALSSTRNALAVNPSNNPATTTVVRLINTTAQTGAVTATAYDEAGATVGTVNAALGAFAPRQIMGFTSAQLESMIGYTPSSQSARYRIAFSASLSGFELINFIKDNATGNLVLAQTQIDDRGIGAATSGIRNAVFVNASSSSNKTSIVRMINLGNQSGAVTATAYNEAGTPVGKLNAALGTLTAQQTLTFTSAQLETLIGYTPASATAKYRVVFFAGVPNFETLNYISDVATGNVTLGQAQVD